MGGYCSQADRDEELNADLLQHDGKCEPMDGRSLPQPLFCEVATTGTRGRRDPYGLPVQRSATNALGIWSISQTAKGAIGK